MNISGTKTVERERERVKNYRYTLFSAFVIQTSVGEQVLCKSVLEVMLMIKRLIL